MGERLVQAAGMLLLMIGLLCYFVAGMILQGDCWYHTIVDFWKRYVFSLVILINGTMCVALSIQLCPGFGSKFRRIADWLRRILVRF